MKNVFWTVVIVGGVLLILSIGAGLVVLAVSAIGRALMQWLPYSLFEASLLSLLALFAVIYLLSRVLNLIQSPFVTDTRELDDDDDEYEEDEDEDGPNGSDFVPSIPRWRQPLSARKYEGVGRNDPCPCGSGKKYKYCHGRSVSKV